MTEYEKILQQYWGYPKFRPLQQEIIESVCSGKDTLGLMPTGGGKSITFQVAALSRPGTCIVVTPLIALMKDQVDNLKRRGIQAVAIYSGMSRVAIEQAYDNCVLGNYKFLYISPERLKTQQFLDVLKRLNVCLLAIDESHCISQWGYDFRPSYLEIANIRQYLPKVPVLALTATATPDVVVDIQEKLQFKELHSLSKSFERKNLTYFVKKKNDKLGALLTICQKTKGTGIVYVSTRKETKEIAFFLQQNGIIADFYHGGLDSKTRVQKQELWMRNPNEVMVSTNAFGMGIDKPNVRFVVHLHIPESLEAYFQEAGRAGRDEKDAFAILFYNDADIQKSKDNFEKKYPSLDFVRQVYDCLATYCNIGIGYGAKQVCDFNLIEFCQTYKLPFVETSNSIKLLNEEDIIVSTEIDDATSKLQFLLNRFALYRYQVEHPETDNFIKLILRNYPGVFTERVNFYEDDMARRFGMSVDELKKILTFLKQVEVIDYEPAKQTPIIIFNDDRVLAEQLHFNEARIKERQERQRKRLNAILHYVTSDNKCRSMQLLEYFGETTGTRCGNCDVCMTRNSVDVNKLQFDYIVEELKSIIGNQPATLSEIIRNSKFEEEKIVDVIHYLLDKGKIIYSDGARLVWNNLIP